VPIRKPKPDEIPSLRHLTISAVAAVLVALLLVVTVVLPAERGIDPTGIGARLQLTRMGLLKQAMGEPDAPAQGRPNKTGKSVIAIAAGDHVEIKMVMKKGYVAAYSWLASGALHHDTHGDLKHNEEIYITYSRADSVTSDSGIIEAPFTGNHGWFWKNTGDQPVEVTLETSGEYVGTWTK